jgi:hypothetical protein
MKKSRLKQIIKEEIAKVLNQNTIDEGWKENILVGLASLAGSLGGVKAQDIAQNTSPKNKTEISSSSPYLVLIGYLVELGNSGIRNQDPDKMEAIRDARIYLENIRDGQTPGSLSEEAKFVLDYAIKETKSLSGFELKRLSDLGSGIKTTNY